MRRRRRRRRSQESVRRRIFVFAGEVDIYMCRERKMIMIKTRSVFGVKIVFVCR